MDDKKIEPNWLIRDISNNVRGPYTNTEILNLIKKGIIRGKSEICKSNSYWFTLEEKNEVGRFFPELFGGSASEVPTQMTATLTEANIGEDQGVEITQFTPQPTRNQLHENSRQGSVSPEKKDTVSIALDTNQNEPAKPDAGGSVQWLSDELAEEFGVEVTSLSKAIPKPGSPELGVPHSLQETGDLLQDQSGDLPGLKIEGDSTRGITVGANERVKPLNTLIKIPDSKSMPLPQSEGIKSPVSEHPKKSNFKVLVYIGLGIVLGIILFWGFGAILNRQKLAEENEAALIAKRNAVNPETSLKLGFILFDLEKVKQSLTEVELSKRGSPIVPLAQALLKREFLFEIDGALAALQAASTLAMEKKTKGEVENLQGLYQIERDPALAAGIFRKAIEANPEEPVYRYNLANAFSRTNKSQEVQKILDGLENVVQNSPELYNSTLVLSAWIKLIRSRGQDPTVESSFSRILERFPYSEKARLGLAIYRLRKSGMSDSEQDFRVFLDLVPDLELHNHVTNYRKLSDAFLYDWAMDEIRELNVPGGVVGGKPSPLVMAVYGVLSAIQNKNDVANKNIDSALSLSPGEENIIKAAAYIRWRDEKYEEVVGLLKDLQRERGSFSVNLMLGKAYLKLGKKAMAEKYFSNMINNLPGRSEGWSMLGELKWQNNNSAEAIQDFKMALTKDPYDLLALKGLYRNNKDEGDLKLLVIKFAEYLPF